MLKIEKNEFMFVVLQQKVKHLEYWPIKIEIVIGNTQKTKIFENPHK